MLNPLGILILFIGMSFSVFAETSSLEEHNYPYFESLEYFDHEVELPLSDVVKLSDRDWNKIPIEDASFGFDVNHYWFRLTLKNTYALTSPWFFRSKYPLLDHLDVYFFSADKLIQEFHTGDKLLFKQRPLDQPSFVFPLNIRNDGPHTIYMHVQTSSSLQLSLTMQSESSFWQTIAIENAASAAFYAILISMVFYNGVIFFIVRERSYLYYTLYLAAFTLFMASIHGWSYKFLWPNNPNAHQLSVVFMIGITISTAALFSISFLKLEKVWPALYRFVLGLSLVAALSSVLSLFLPYALMIKFMAALTIISAAIAIFATIHEWLRNRRREIMMFIVAWSTLLIGFLLYSGQKFGLVPINTFTEHAIEIGAVLEALLLALGLADRINSERKDHILTQERMLAIQIRANEELDNKVRERTEELEMLNDQLQETSITDSLTQIKNRHYFDKKLPAEYRRAYREKTWISLLIMDIDHFKKFNDDHGHQAGDKVLQAVASAIQDVIKRPSDAVSRYGGEEFTAILPSTPREGAFNVGERIRESIESLQVEWGEEILTVTMSVGIASCIPSHYEGEAMLLKQADDYLYVAKDYGRNQVISEDNDPSAQG